ncbi:hypothetical protein BBK82_24710 [Lentzea guizhouensis]|uniref:Uncharacterized protein n=1 Tax=Lentzea guizhouensis TaxID=1586287 RepID=A0A1B2HM26_9PSEU|nr:hypothetical protein BBK82_24710 [Lentzea guizhouensis]
MVLGAALTAVASLNDLYTSGHEGPAPFATQTVSLWGAKSDAVGDPDVTTVMNAGVPVLLAAAVMVVAAVLTLVPAPRTIGTARTTTMIAAGGLVGLVLAFVVGVLHEEELMSSAYDMPGHTYRMSYLPGLYLLAAGGLVGLIGAVLVQRRQPTDDDHTPPSGTAVPAEAGEHQRD